MRLAQELERAVRRSRRIAPLAAIVGALFVVGRAPVVAAEVPSYDVEQTRSVIEMMIAAHGGMQRWMKAPTVSFTRKATFAGKPEHPWILHETIEQGARRLYQDWPEEQAVLADDGNEVWTLNWSNPFPPRFVAQIGFYFLNLPWITQDAGIILEDAGRGRHPASDTEYLKVAMRFEPGTGETANDRYVLYIDAEDFLLRAIEYHVSYGALLDASYLPPSVRSIGPFFHVNHEFEEVEGLTVPVRYSVYGKEGRRSIVGEVTGWSFREPFDESRLIKPVSAVVDESNPTRVVSE